MQRTIGGNAPLSSYFFLCSFLYSLQRAIAASLVLAQRTKGRSCRACKARLKGAQQLGLRLSSRRTRARGRQELIPLLAGLRQLAARIPRPQPSLGYAATGLKNIGSNSCHFERREKSGFLILLLGISQSLRFFEMIFFKDFDFQPHRSAAETGALSRIRSLCCLSARMCEFITTP